ncbi:hypothetical protein Poli38472_014692 [Pythium oligandrum]|uniref:Uncharacterized protein n=1 Tax=Pythium oligandrum TaxID=41045 RepID=A0A8K1CKM7_PYTOL|nr:hypothetical protein Poli38472_014692 [Pythium oligandrum]|eukprot:TMW63987.1 hypothetical protein Poli38472_014692 [Pythium oligandrum]
MSTSVPKTPIELTKPLESMSPAGAFVSVFTPTDQSAMPGTEDIDINGIKIGAWSSELNERDVRSTYYWTVCCCPCVPLSHLDVRLGWASYPVALLRYGLAYAIVFVLFLATVIKFFGQVVAHGRDFWLFLALLVCFLLSSVLVSYRVTHLRSEVRERFQIPGTIKEDQRVALFQTNRAIRQMGKHLQCDRAYFRGAPTTLQAYQV